jgi:hypothetical protein
MAHRARRPVPGVITGLIDRGNLNMQLAVRCWLLTASLQLGSGAVADVANFSFQAEVTSVEAPAGHPVSGRLRIGDSISGTLQYDLGLTDELEHLSRVGSYEALPAGANRFQASGGNGFVFDSSFVPRPFFVATVDDGPQYDTLLVNMSGDTVPSTLQRADTEFVEMGLLLETANTALFPSDALPQHLSLDAFELAGLDFFGIGTAVPTFLVHTTITALATMPPSIEGDYNGNGWVEQGDLDLVLLNWGKAAEIAAARWFGLLPIGIVDQGELDGALLNWGSAALAASVAPEPAAAGLAAICVCMLLLLQRRPVSRRRGFAQRRGNPRSPTAAARSGFSQAL